MDQCIKINQNIAGVNIIQLSTVYSSSQIRREIEVWVNKKIKIAQPLIFGSV